MKAVIHIGTHRTGTSAIQHFLKQNRESLKKQGVFIPTGQFSGWAKQPEVFIVAANPEQWHLHPLLFQCGHFLGNQVFKKKMTQKIQEGRWKTFWHNIQKNCKQDDLVVFSCEELELLTKGEVGNLRTLMNSLFDDVTIVLYLRRQPEFLVSFYNSAIRLRAMQWNLPDYLKQPDEQSILAYHELVKRWSVFGKNKLKIRIFDRREFLNNDLLSDFANVIGIDLHGLKRVEDQNLSIDSSKIEFLRLLNAHIPAFEQCVRNPASVQLLKCFNSIFGSVEKSQKAYHLTRQEARYILDMCKEGNDGIAREYFGRETLFSDSVSMYPEEVASPHNLTIEKYAEYTAALFGELRERQKIARQLKSLWTRIKKGASKTFGGYFPSTEEPSSAVNCELLKIAGTEADVSQEVQVLEHPANKKAA